MSTLARQPRGATRSYLARRGPTSRAVRLQVVARQAALKESTEPTNPGLRLQFCMLPAGITYGVEMELTFPSGVTRALVQQHLNAAGASSWKVKPDASLQCLSRAGCTLLELNSPRLQGIEGAQAILNACRAIKPLEPKVNKTTALHVHIGKQKKQWKLQHLKNICINWVYFEPTLDMLVPHSRRGNDNQYCRSMLTALGGDPEVAAAFIQDAPNRSALINRVNAAGRYAKLNLHALERHNMIEFRHPGGTQNGDKVVRYVQMYVSFVLRSQNFAMSGPLGELERAYPIQHLLRTMYAPDWELHEWVPRRAVELFNSKAAGAATHQQGH